MSSFRVDVVVGVWKAKAQLVLLPFFASERSVSRMSYGSSSPVGVEARRKSPYSWSRRRSKLTWVYGRQLRAMAKVSKALWLI